jgi:hypothetical protein
MVLGNEYRDPHEVCDEGSTAACDVDCGRPVCGVLLVRRYQISMRSRDAAG